jgi:hypothetical protein
MKPDGEKRKTKGRTAGAIGGWLLINPHKIKKRSSRKRGGHSIAEIVVAIHLRGFQF